MKQRISHFILFVVLIAIDQVSKYLIKTNMQQGVSKHIIPGLINFRYHKNDGAIWGILSGQISFLIVLTIILVALLTYFYLKIPMDRHYNILKIIWVFIMAGAIGNFIDRITLRYVVDFLEFDFIDFPIFNVADSYLTVSCILLFVLVLFYYKDKDLAFIDAMFSGKKKKPEDSDTSGKDA